MSLIRTIMRFTITNPVHTLCSTLSRIHSQAFFHNHESGPHIVQHTFTNPQSSILSLSRIQSTHCATRFHESTLKHSFIVTNPVHTFHSTLECTMSLIWIKYVSPHPAHRRSICLGEYSNDFCGRLNVLTIPKLVLVFAKRANSPKSTTFL